MTAVLDASHEIIDCPHCKGKVKVEVEREPATVKIAERTSPAELESMIERAFEKKMPKVEAKKEEKAPEVPSYLPKHFCKGKGCEGHDNKGRKKVTKKCTNCDQVSPENAGKCPWCGENDFDDLDEDDLERFNAGLAHDHEHE